MTRYISEGFQPIRRSDEVASFNDAADIFANRLARRELGKRGYARIVRPDSWSEDGTSATYQVFIGTDERPFGRNGSVETVGRNVWLYVHARN